jgi:hypothetical protein
MDNTKWILGVMLAAILALALLAGGFIAGRLTSPVGYGFVGGADDWSRAFREMMRQGGMTGGWRGAPQDMMGGNLWNRTEEGERLTVGEAMGAAEQYLQAAGYDGLEVAEVMIFDNHAYVEVEDSERGIGALELLVDPASKAAFLEFGPSMMWNVEYGMMGSQGGRYGGMMAGWRGGMGWVMRRWSPSTEAFDPESLSVTPEEAVQIAEDYLREAFPDLTVDDHAELFPGYYTLHTLENGEVEGMLSVSGYTGEVWVHTWHGGLLEVSEVE